MWRALEPVIIFLVGFIATTQLVLPPILSLVPGINVRFFWLFRKHKASTADQKLEEAEKHSIAAKIKIQDVTESITEEELKIADRKKRVKNVKNVTGETKPPDIKD